MAAQKLKVETKLFQKLVALAQKGSMPTEEAEITECMAIRLKDGKLTLITSDGRNYLYVHSDKVPGKDFYVVVTLEKFAKLVSKSTNENIVLEIKTDTKKKVSYLDFTCDGTYKLDLPYDYDGELVTFPDPIEELETNENDAGWEDTNINLSTVKLLLTTGKAAILKSNDTSLHYTGYYLGGKAIATDTYKICVVDVDVFDDENPKLLSAQTMELLGTFDKEEININFDEERAIISTDNMAIFTTFMDSIDQYPSEAIYARLEAPFSSKCTIDRAAFVRLLDRMKLFISDLDNNGVNLTFTKDGIAVSTQSSNGEELLEYLDSKGFQDFECMMDITMLIDVLKANAGTKVQLCYGRDDIIKVVDGSVSTAIALADDEEDGEENEGGEDDGE